MNKTISFVFLLFLSAGCNNKPSTYTTYTGTIAEKNSLSTIPNLNIRITDGTNVYSEAITNSAGQFSMDLAHNNNLGPLYLYIDGNEIYPSKRVDLVYTNNKLYDYGVIFLYDQADPTLFPKISNVSWDYPNEDKSIRFKDVAISSNYLLKEAYIEISNNDSFIGSKKYTLAVQENGKYSTIVDDLIVGERFYFRAVATNAIGTAESDIYFRVFGFPIPSIVELKKATVSTATLQMVVEEDPLLTLAAGLCWSTSHNPTINIFHSEGKTNGISDVILTGLDFRSNTYYVRAYAQNSNGIAYSDEITLPVNNPFSLPTFTSGGHTYAYQYIGKGTWYSAYDTCLSLVDVFNDWTLPSYSKLVDLFNSYCKENNEMPLLPIWSMRDLDYQEPQESETFMLTQNGFILASKREAAYYYAIRDITTIK